MWWPPGVTSPLPADSGILRRILHVLYTDCVRQCSGPMYVVSAGTRAPGSVETLPGSPPQSSCPPPLTAPLPFSGPNGAPGHGKHHQLVAVSAELGTCQIPPRCSPSLLPPPPRSCGTAVPPWGWAEDRQLMAPVSPA